MSCGDTYPGRDRRSGPFEDRLIGTIGGPREIVRRIERAPLGRCEMATPGGRSYTAFTEVLRVVVEFLTAHDRHDAVGT